MMIHFTQVLTVFDVYKTFVCPYNILDLLVVPLKFTTKAHT
jgi:hypothetical protein